MSFIQIIEYETDRADEIKALGEARIAQMPQAQPEFRLVVTRDRDRPNRYVTIVEFPSYEVAMEASARPDTDAFAKEMAARARAVPATTTSMSRRQCRSRDGRPMPVDKLRRAVSRHPGQPRSRRRTPPPPAPTRPSTSNESTSWWPDPRIPPRGLARTAAETHATTSSWPCRRTPGSGGARRPVDGRHGRGPRHRGTQSPAGRASRC